MEAFINAITGLKIKTRIRDDDTIDQLHHFFTVYLLAAFAILVGVREYTVGQLDCYYNSVTSKHFQEHANTYCWTHKLYKYPNPENLSQVPYSLSPDSGGPANSTSLGADDHGEIVFYRWITVIFLCQALMFKLPNVIWAECNENSGTQIEKMVGMVSSCSFDTPEKKNAMFASVAEFLETWLKINRQPFWFMKSRVGQETNKILQHWMLCMGANTGNYLSTMYLIVKSMFLVNVFLQFFILASFLKFDYWGYGFRFMQMLYNDGDNDNVHFPRVALCHFQVRGQGQWIQCLLTGNMLLEKLFVVEWFWLFFVLILTVFSFIAWVLRVLRTDRSVKFVTKYLSVLNEDGSQPQEGNRTPVTFIHDYLGNDGVFVLRIIATNTNDVVMSDLVTSVWRRYIDYNNVAVKPKSLPNQPAPSIESTFDNNDLSTKRDKANVEFHSG